MFALAPENNPALQKMLFDDDRFFEAASSRRHRSRRIPAWGIAELETMYQVVIPVLPSGHALYVVTRRVAEGQYLRSLLAYPEAAADELPEHLAKEAFELCVQRCPLLALFGAVCAASVEGGAA